MAFNWIPFKPQKGTPTIIIYLFIINLPQGKERYKRQACTRYCPNTKHILPQTKHTQNNTYKTKQINNNYNYIYKTTNQQQ